MEELVRPHSEDALKEYLARMGLSDGRIKQQPLREALRSIVGFCDHERLRDDTLLQAIRAVAERADRMPHGRRCASAERQFCRGAGGD